MHTQTASRAAPEGLRLLLLALFALSGFSALIYQSIWTHYLGLVLGHAAYAQTLVLMLFMGGMALGSWGVSRRTLTLRRLIGLYALVEALIGLFGLGFHPVFVALSQFGQDRVLPALPAGGWADAWQWLSAAALITPQTLMLGATFPLIAAGVLRAFPAQGSSAQLGGLYFTNGIGAACGALAATFLLLPAIGMPGALVVAALLNFVLAAATAWLSRRLGERDREPPPTSTASAGVDSQDLRRLRRGLLLATFASSAASFGYEIGWVRLLNQALGTTLHGFELMLTAFIAGLALGGLWIQRRGERIHDLVRYAGCAQVLMGLAALLSVPMLANSFAWVGWWMEALARSGPGYTLYSLATALTALLIMLPAAFFAGMTLPLFTAALLRRGADEKAVGQVYAANTLGAIVGIALFVHLIVPKLGVSLGLIAAATIDIAVGFVLLRSFSPARWTPWMLGLVALGLVAETAVIHAGRPDPAIQTLGVYRSGYHPESGGTLDFFRDGATATISVRTRGNISVIATNGKSDAGLTPWEDPPTQDEITMLIAGALPLAAHPKPERVGVIGWGSGLTTHTLLGSKLPQRVDSIEIEPAMWEGAKNFYRRNYRAYRDPRSIVHFDDARKYMATQGSQPFDVLVSEPSNPWVSGVSSLFTREFYALARRHLKPDGMLVQWIQVYEISDELVAQMLAALLEEFPNTTVYQANSGDLIFLARRGETHPLGGSPWTHPMLAEELRRVGLGSVHDLDAHRLAGPRALRNYVGLMKVRPHTDFKPTVALAAPEQRFRRSSATLLSVLVTGGLPVLNALDCRAVPDADVPLTQVLSGDVMAIEHLLARLTARALLERERHPKLASLSPDLINSLDALLAQRSGQVPVSETLALQHFSRLAMATLGSLDLPTQQRFWRPAEWLVPSWQPTPALRTQIALHDAVARQDWRAAEAAARGLLSQPNLALVDITRDSTTILGLLAAARLGPETSLAWQREFAPRIQSPHWRGVAAYIERWVKTEPICGVAGEPHGPQAGAAAATAREPGRAGPAPAP